APASPTAFVRRRTSTGQEATPGAAGVLNLSSSSSFRGAPLGASPESILPIVVMDSGLAASRRPGMTEQSIRVGIPTLGIVMIELTLSSWTTAVHLTLRVNQ